jgi:hypothetical protein
MQVNGFLKLRMHAEQESYTRGQGEGGPEAREMKGGREKLA